MHACIRRSEGRAGWYGPHVHLRALAHSAESVVQQSICHVAVQVAHKDVEVSASILLVVAGQSPVNSHLQAQVQGPIQCMQRGLRAARVCVLDEAVSRAASAGTILCATQRDISQGGGSFTALCVLCAWLKYQGLP